MVIRPDGETKGRWRQAEQALRRQPGFRNIHRGRLRPLVPGMDMKEHQNPPPPEAISIEFDTGHLVRSICTMEIEGAWIRADDGREFTGQKLVGYNAVAAVMERQLRDEAGPFRGIVIQRQGYLEMEAVWDGERLIDGDGSDLAIGMESEDELE
jgi:hypothetical protein